MKIQKIAQWLREHISLNKSRAQYLMIMMKGMILLRTVNLQASLCELRLTWQPMSRFLKEIQINPLEILRMIAVFLRLKKINKIGLIVDRINWKRGEKYLNFLFIALKTKNWTIPVWVLPMCEQKQGNHSMDQLKSALNAILQIIPAEKIDYFLGDAEFGYLSRIQLFQERGIPYIY